MDIQSLTNDILQIINETMEDHVYTGKLKIEYEDGWYYLLMYLDQEQSPLVMGYQGTEEQFKTYIQSEIRKRKMERVSFWKGIQELPYLACDEDTGEWYLEGEDIIIT